MGSCFSLKQLPDATVSIDDLSDDILDGIFKHLPLFDRLTISEVSRRWRGISQMPWRDVISIDFTGIPVRHLAAIIKQCPNVRTVRAFSAPLYQSKALHALARAPYLSSVKLYDVNVSGTNKVELLSSLFSRRLRIYSALQVLVLSNASVTTSASSAVPLSSAWLPASLTHLQLSDVRAYGPFEIRANCLALLWRLQNLTCLILFGAYGGCWLNEAVSNFAVNGLGDLASLRELCIGRCDQSQPAVDICDLPFLPKLQVLFLFNVSNHSASADDLLTTHPALRILVVSGYSGCECTIPARLLYPNGFDSAPLPVLHVFLDKQPSEHIRFTHSPSSLKVYPISEPLPTFLEREEIAPIFDGVWIAAQIKEGSKHGTQLYDSLNEPASSIIFA